MNIAARDEAVTPPQYIPVGKVFAVGIGNALEFYDFLTYSYFAIQIGHCFFSKFTKRPMVYSFRWLHLALASSRARWAG